MPRCLDLYCGIGGAGEGYRRAGYEVTGVDINANCQRYYPGQFLRRDALTYLAEHGDEYDLIHASPPCQRYSHATVAIDRSDYADYLEPTLQALAALDVPSVVENVAMAPMPTTFVLCGSMFGLSAVDSDGVKVRLERHRRFVVRGVDVTCDLTHAHDRSVQVAGVYGGARRTIAGAHQRAGGYVPAVETCRDLLGIHWPSTWKGLCEAIPPAYTEWLGRQVLDS